MMTADRPLGQGSLAADQLERLRSFSLLLLDQNDLNGLCWAIESSVCNLLKFDDCVVYIRRGDRLVQMAAHGAQKRADGAIRNPLELEVGQGVVGAVAKSGEAERIDDVQSDARYIRDNIKGQSELAVPIVYEGRVLGVLDSESPRPGAFSSQDQLMLQSIANIAAPRIASAMLHEGSAQREAYKDLLARMARMPAIAAGDIKMAFAAITECAARTLHADRANLWLFSDDGTQLRCLDHYSLASDTHESGARLTASDYPRYFEFLHQQRSLVIDDVRSDERTAEFVDNYIQQYDIGAMLDSPVRSREGVAGVLCIEEQGRPRHWTDDEASFAASLSDFATLALASFERAQAEKALSQVQKFDAMGRLAGCIAHDFNNLLTVICGGIEVIRDHRGLPEELHSTTEMIVRASDRATALTRKLLAFGRRQVLEIRKVECAEILDAVESFSASMLNDNITLKVVKPNRVCWVSVDPLQIQQVMVNLVLNANDAMSSGGTIVVTPEIIGQELALRVQDDGEGMNEALLGRIFEPFFTTRNRAGGGLGLSVSQGIVEQHGGRLSVASETGLGTTISLFLPLTDPPAPSAVPGAEEQRVAAHPRILLVEDEAQVREIVSRMLTRSQMEVVVAENASDALRLLDEKSIDLMVSDVIMPDLNGPELYERALENHPDLQCLFISGHTEDMLKSLSSTDTQVAYLAKPFTISQLNAAVRGLLDESRKRR